MEGEIKMSKVIEQKHELIRDYENGTVTKEDYDIKIVDLIQKEKEELSIKLNDLKEKINIKREEIQSLPRKADKKTIRILYKESIELYRNIESALIDSRGLKKLVRDLL